jgi:hypothetical protein
MKAVIRLLGLRFWVFAVLGLMAGCSTSPEKPIDLLAALPQADLRADPPLEQHIRADTIGPPGNARPAIRCEAPARLVWKLGIPHRAQLSTAVTLLSGSGVALRFYVGDRIYEQLFQMRLVPPPSGVDSWHPVTIDLSAYAGWQWSLFYRPSESLWRISFYVDAAPGGVMAWAQPTIQAR